MYVGGRFEQMPVAPVGVSATPTDPTDLHDDLKIGELTNWKIPMAIVLLTGLLGAALAKHQGLAVLRKIREQIEMGVVPAAPILDGVFVLVGGALLITPGVLTDAVGIMFLLPVTRKLCKRLLKRRIEARITHIRPG